MNICEKKPTPLNTTNPKYLSGHLYKSPSTSVLYLADSFGNLISVKDGEPAYYGSIKFGNQVGWEDVTDKYCLQEI